MPSPRSWVSPPTRREATLLLFSLTIFVLSYNLETSLRMVGVSPSKLSSSYLGVAVLKDPGFERDGKRPQAWRDDLENVIAGDWDWEEGEIAGVKRGQLGMAMGAGTGQRTIYNVGKNRKASRSASREDPGVGLTEGVTVGDQFLRIEYQIPQTRSIAHVPGYTILENLYVLNGTFYIVTDSPGSVPPLNAIASSTLNPHHTPRVEDWRVINTAQANDTLGTYLGRFRQTTWLSTESADAQDPYTLFSFFRAHNHLAATQPTSRSSVPPPVRLWFPRIPIFSSPEMPALESVHNAHPPPRQRSYTGLHPMTLKAVLPTIAVKFEEDWQDYSEMHLPYLFERVIIADRGAAERSREEWSTKWIPILDTHGADEISDELRKRQVSKLNEDGLPAWAAPFVGLQAQERWWAPVRDAMLSHLEISDAALEKKSKPVVTLVSMEDEPYEAGAHIRTEDYPELVAGLQRLEKQGLVGEFHIIKGNGTKESWEERMKIITRTDILMGAFGHNLADSLYMPAPLTRQNDATPSVNGVPVPSHPAPLVIEFWPSSAFLRDREFSVRSLGMRYMAWWDDRRFTSSIPPVMNLRTGQSMWVTAVVPNVLDEIRAEAERWKS